MTTSTEYGMEDKRAEPNYRLEKGDKEARLEDISTYAEECPQTKQTVVTGKLWSQLGQEAKK